MTCRIGVETRGERENLREREFDPLRLIKEAWR